MRSHTDIHTHARTYTHSHPTDCFPPFVVPLIPCPGHVQGATVPLAKHIQPFPVLRSNPPPERVISSGNTRYLNGNLMSHYGELEPGVMCGKGLLCRYVCRFQGQIRSGRVVKGLFSGQGGMSSVTCVHGCRSLCMVSPWRHGRDRLVLSSQ